MHLLRVRSLREQGRLGEALAAIQGFAVGDIFIQGFAVGDIFIELDRLVALEPDLPAILRGEREPRDADERLLFARLCHYKGEHEAAAEQFLRFFAEDDRPWFCGIRDDASRDPWSHYQAARSAILAAGSDLPAAKRSRWRRQAVTWLAELAGRYREYADIAGARQFDDLLWRLLRLREDPAFAPVRDEAEIARLPEEEQQACRRVRAELDRLWREIR